MNIEIDDNTGTHYLQDQPLKFVKAIGDDYVVFSCAHNKLIVARSQYNRKPYQVQLTALMKITVLVHDNQHSFSIEAI